MNDSQIVEAVNATVLKDEIFIDDEAGKGAEIELNRLTPSSDPPQLSLARDERGELVRNFRMIPTA